MDISLYKDVIKDERGNYYRAIAYRRKKLVLVHAFIDLSFDTVLEFTRSFQEKHREYEHQFLGKEPMDRLRHDYMSALENRDGMHLYSLKEVEEYYDIEFIDAIEFFRHTQAGRPAL